MLNLWAVTPVGSTRFEGVATNSVVTHREEATPTHREEVTSTRRVALIHRSCTLAARCEERERKKENNHILSSSEVRETPERRKRKRRRKQVALQSFFFIFFSVAARFRECWKGKLFVYDRELPFFMLTRKEVSKRLKAKAMTKDMAERVYIYTYPGVCIQRKLTWGTDKLESSNIRNM